MKKGLLIWNVIVTVVALVAIFGACTSDSRVDWCIDQIQAQQITINNLQSDINYLKSVDSQLTAQFNAQNASLQDQINQLIVIISNR